MKLGLILECGPFGADKKVCEQLISKLDPTITARSVTLDNKSKLIFGCGQAALGLFATGCDKVIVVWDLHPPWDTEKPCMKQDRDNIFASLNEAGVDIAKVSLVCIVQELEAWLLADGRALSTVLSKPTHPVTISDESKPEKVQNPKRKLNRLFEQNLGRPYDDSTDAERIVKLLPDLKKLQKRCPTFARFASKITS